MDESGHEQVRGLPAPLVVSALARVEVAAGIWRKHRTGELDFDDSLLLTRAFAADYAGTPNRAQRFLTVAATGGVIERAADLAGTHSLRAYDAVQLASALAIRELDGRCTVFASFDRGLALAAVAEGFSPFPPIRPQSRKSLLRPKAAERSARLEEADERRRPILPR